MLTTIRVQLTGKRNMLNSIISDLKFSIHSSVLASVLSLCYREALLFIHEDDTTESMLLSVVYDYGRDIIPEGLIDTWKKWDQMGHVEYYLPF